MTSTFLQNQTDRVEIGKMINHSIEWALTKDKECLCSIVAQDANFFISHLDSKSTVLGCMSFKEMAEREWMNPAFRATNFAAQNLRITVSQSSTVAWYSAYLDDHTEWDGRRIGWDNVRAGSVVRLPRMMTRYNPEPRSPSATVSWFAMCMCR